MPKRELARYGGVLVHVGVRPVETRLLSMPEKEEEASGKSAELALVSCLCLLESLVHDVASTRRESRDRDLRRLRDGRIFTLLMHR